MARFDGRDVSIRLGGGSAFFNDRLDAAVELVEKGRIDVLILECLAERTLALLHVARRSGQHGYWERLPYRLNALLPALAKHDTRLVTNAGGADPIGAAHMVVELTKSLGLTMDVAAVTGDDVTQVVQDLDPVLAETREPLSKLGSEAIAVNAYLGADAIADACRAGAHVIVTGRVTDSALALGPIRAALDWSPSDYNAMGCGVMTGHLLECGGQATGGYFAEPCFKDVPDLDRLGFPIAEVRRDGSVIITKPPGSGGGVDRHTVTEQLLYEMHDPAAYLTPDVTLDLTDVEMAETAPDEVRLTGVRGKAPPDTLKVLVGVESGMLVEAEISYAGINAIERAKLAMETVRKRLGRVPGIANQPARYDLIGVNSLWPFEEREAYRDVRLRVAVRVRDREAAERVITEVESLYVNGPAGGGGVRFAMRPTIRTYTTYLPRRHASAKFEMVT